MKKFIVLMLMLLTVCFIVVAHAQEEVSLPYSDAWQASGTTLSKVRTYDELPAPQVVESKSINDVEAELNKAGAAIGIFAGQKKLASLLTDVVTWTTLQIADGNYSVVRPVLERRIASFDEHMSPFVTLRAQLQALYDQLPEE